MKIVLDTNCLKPIVIPHSFCWDVWQAFVAGEYTLCVSNEILMEYHEILERKYQSPEFADMVISVLVNAENVEFITPAYHFGLIKEDEDDNKFVDCAISAGATYIVSNDKHFKVLKQIPFPHVEVKTLREFKEIINNKSNIYQSNKLTQSLFNNLKFKLMKSNLFNFRHGPKEWWGLGFSSQAWGSNLLIVPRSRG